MINRFDLDPEAVQAAVNAYLFASTTVIQEAIPLAIQAYLLHPNIVDPPYSQEELAFYNAFTRYQHKMLVRGRKQDT